MKIKRQNRTESNNFIYMVILITFIALTLGTFVHDPLLHGFIAKLNGWQIGDYETGLMTGSTDAIISFSEASKATTLSYWLFYMFPSIFIFFGVIILTLINPNRLILVAGIVMTFLNLSSLNPSIQGSDAFNSVQMLMTRGWTESSAYGLHYGIWGLFWILWVLYIYISIENNSKDTKNRIRNIYS
ncbi:MAG: hypothetical protein OIN86_12935 [Candidatus Methanoperedens sp.]|nr:hypothetical protein [Candidatus Methanoperedens sp.]CAG0948591.1 hypothetical protein METP1_00040 [Methanosarcinales archaeon]